MTNSRRITYSSYASSLWQRLLIHLTEFFTGRHSLQKIYDQVLDQHLDNTTFWSEALKQLNVQVNVKGNTVDKISAKVPLIVIANHPFGVIDGLAICDLVSKVRPDFKIVLNHVLCQDSRIDKHVLPIDFSPTRAAKVENLNTRKACLAELAQGGTVIIFPAGGVSTASSSFGKALDLEWKPFTVKLIEKSQASDLPLFFHGQNSALFQFVSQFSETLRVGMLVKEVNNKRNGAIDIQIGDIIPYDQLAPLESTHARILHLRRAVYALESNSSY